MEAIEKLVDNTINGIKSIKAELAEKAQDKASEAIAKLKKARDNAKLLKPQIETAGKELAVLEKQIIAKQARLDIDTEEYNIKNIAYNTLKIEYDAAVRINSGLEKNDIKRIDIKSLKVRLKNADAELESCQNKIDDDKYDISVIETDIQKIKDKMFALNAQISPEASLAALKIEKSAATGQDADRIDEKIKEVQAIADEEKRCIDQIQEMQKPKMDMLKAEFQMIEMGVQSLQYLVTNMSIQTPLPSFVGTGSPNPARTISDGNVNYGILFYILGTLKVSAMRFKTIAVEIGYEPTVEMATLEMIPLLEGQVKSFMGMAPAGAVLGK